MVLVPNLGPMTLDTGAVTQYVCSACGNRTRFDVVESLRRRRYHHYTLGGDLSIDEESVLDHVVESVTCRWCERSDSVEPLQV